MIHVKFYRDFIFVPWIIIDKNLQDFGPIVKFWYLKVTFKNMGYQIRLLFGLLFYLVWFKLGRLDFEIKSSILVLFFFKGLKLYIILTKWKKIKIKG